MKPHWQIGLEQALTLGGIGLLIGGLGGWVSVIFGDGIESVTSIAAKSYWVVIILIPACLVYMTNDNFTKNNHKYYSNITQSLILLLIAGIGGVLASSALFLIPATNLPFVFEKLDAIEVREALYAQIGQVSFFLYLGITTIVAIATAIWANKKENNLEKSDS